ncbi:DUF7673 family protein [Brevundimonas staleyi]
MDPTTWAALERLLEIARGDTGQCRYVANFLLAWWNAGTLGGFDLTEAWGVDDAIGEDMITVFSFVVRNNEYPSAYTFQTEFEDLVRLWRPEVVKAAETAA